MSIVIELKRGAQPKKVLNQLINTRPCNHLRRADAGAGGWRTAHPALKRSLQIFIEHRQVVIVRRTNLSWRKPAPASTSWMDT
jgi:DNA gyrase subunit A